MVDQSATNPASQPVNATVFFGGGGGSEIKRGDLAAKHSLLSNAAGAVPPLLSSPFVAVCVISEARRAFNLGCLSAIKTCSALCNV